jgi:transcriptional regulator with XRE-family HTH domain
MRLKIARRRARLTQQELATRAGIDHTAVAKLELDADRYLCARYQNVVRVARALGRSPLELFPVPPVKRTDDRAAVAR